MSPGVFGRVLKWFDILNPERKPTILFAPGVRESIYFAEEFSKSGIVAAHIDGQDVWANGKLYRSNQEVRDNVLAASKSGKCVVLCNRFVLREGIDAPWLHHCVLATCVGSLSSYIQAVGRLLRAYPGIREVTIQDHGGNWWRHGSPNADRQWAIGATANIVAGRRADELRKAPSEAKPSRCPACGMIQVWKSAVCQDCGHECRPGAKRSRIVVQTDGTLREMMGDIFKPRRTYSASNGPALWKRMYYRSKQPKAKGRTFRAAAALFAMENNWGWPDPKWPWMPYNPEDWFQRVVDVPEDMLIQEDYYDG
jgi:superfamily II DNA or RNA helicase